MEGKKPFLPDIGNRQATPLTTPSKLQAAISRGSSLTSASSVYSSEASLCSHCRPVCRICSRNMASKTEDGAIGGKKEVGTGWMERERKGPDAAASKPPRHGCRRCGFVESPLVKAKKEPEVSINLTIARIWMINSLSVNISCKKIFFLFKCLLTNK